MKVLVTGGAGYIGSHVVALLLARGDDVIVLDDMTFGVRSRVPHDVPLVEASVLDTRAVCETLHRHRIGAVVHFAARKQVGESMELPEYYYTENVGGMASLLTAMRDCDVDRFVFSSSAAVYGMPDLGTSARITEDTPCVPINPYGETKLVCEWLMRAAARATGMRAVGLRYFNVAGAGTPELADTAVLNLVPIALDLVRRGMPPRVYGDDYPTPDGTCIRDYIHVSDLAEAHLAALDHLERGDRPYDVFNVGTGSGASVLDVVGAILRETGSTLGVEVVARRPGDPPALVADPGRIADALGWRATRTLDDIVRSAVAASGAAVAAGAAPS